MRVTYRKFVFVDPVQFNRTEFEEIKNNKTISSNCLNLNFLQDLKFELILIGITIFITIIEVIIPNTFVEILFSICVLFIVVNALPTIFSYIELLIYTKYYNTKLKADLKKSKSYEEFQKLRIKRGFDKFKNYL